jgi:hypothetical protein
MAINIDCHATHASRTVRAARMFSRDRRERGPAHVPRSRKHREQNVGRCPTYPNDCLPIDARKKEGHENRGLPVL